MRQTYPLNTLGERIRQLLTTDFCPGANRYLYWLKEPVGWFFVALCASCLVGAFVSPIGWSIGAGLLAVLVLGLGFPWIAVRSLHCELSCAVTELHEGDQTHLILKISNPLPVPVMGLVIERYLTQPLSKLASVGDANFTTHADCGLARIPPCSSALYHLPIRPEFRGHYPRERPRLACGFPFAIYTARREIGGVTPVTVRPSILPIAADFEWIGLQFAECGYGQRPTDHGEFLGVRDFRHGDSLRSIHWAQSARLDELIVCERGGPQKSPIAIELSTAACLGNVWEAAENLAWRVRVTASLIDLLSARHIPFRLYIDGVHQPLPDGAQAAVVAWDHLAEIPWTATQSTTDASQAGHEPAAERSRTGSAFVIASRGIRIGAVDSDGSRLSDQFIHVEILSDTPHVRTVAGSPARGLRLAAGSGNSSIIDLERPIDVQLVHLLQEVSRDTTAA